MLEVFATVRKVAASDSTGVGWRGERHGQGAGRQSHRRSERQKEGTLRRDQLRRHSREPYRIELLATRGLFYGGPHSAEGKDRAGSRRNSFPRRDRRAAPRPSGQDTPLPPGADDRAHRRARNDEGRRQGGERHEPQPQGSNDERHFPEDLYFRIGVITIQLPRLKERDGDVLLLSHAFLERHSAQGKKKLTGFTPEAIAALEAYDWPGNVRESKTRSSGPS